MLEASDYTTPTAHCDLLLMEANRMYLEIETHYQIMMTNMSDATFKMIESTTTVLNTLQKNVLAIDERIAESLRLQEYRADSTKVLLSKREEILDRLYRTNRSVINKAENIKSLIHHEITNMTKNRTALSGYKQFETERKSIVRNFF